VPERVGPDLREALDNLSREARDAIKWKLGWDSPTLFLAGTVNFGFLSPKIAFVLDRCLEGRQVHVQEILVDVQNDSLLFDQRRQTHFRAPEHLGCRFRQPLQILLESPSARLENLPSLIVYQARFAFVRRETQIRVVNPQQQPISARDVNTNAARIALVIRSSTRTRYTS
jgi:hypothetical protein